MSDESKTQEVILRTSIVYSIAFLSVVLRIAGKVVSQRLSWDDAVVVAALLLSVIPLGCVLDMAVEGFGEHLWNLGDDKLLPILRYSKSCSAYTVDLTDTCSVHFVVRILGYTMYDQDLSGIVLP